MGSQVSLAEKDRSSSDLEEDRANQTLQQKLRELNAAYEISRLATRGQDFDTTLEAMLDIGQANIPVGSCALLLLDSDRETLTVKAVRGYRDEVKNLKIKVGHGITGQCAARGEILHVNDVLDDPHYIPGVEGARSEIAVPLLLEGKVIGVINAEAKQPNAYRESHRRMLTLIAEQAAVVIENARLTAEMRRLAETDPLTGLSNRRHFWSALEESIEEASRFQRPLAVTFFDLDHFKKVNDSHGHLAGDEALQEFAKTLREQVREGDVVGRLGGEEFGVVGLGCNRHQAHRVADRIRAAVEELSFQAGGSALVAFTVSAGIAVYPCDGYRADQLFQAADRALYMAKHQGRNCVISRPDFCQRPD